MRTQEAQAIKELNPVRSMTFPVQKPENSQPATGSGKATLQLPRYELGGDSAATRKAYGDALKALGAANPDVVGLDGEVSNSTYAEEFAKAYPDRFFEQYIAEQQLVASAVGMSVRGTRLLLPPPSRHSSLVPMTSSVWPPFPAPTFALRLTCRSFNRRRWPIADGTGRLINDACHLRQYRCLSLRPEPDGTISGGNGRPTVSSTCAQPARRLPVFYGPDEPVPHRRQQGAALIRPRRNDDCWRWYHAPRGIEAYDQLQSKGIRPASLMPTR